MIKDLTVPEIKLLQSVILENFGPLLRTTSTHNKKRLLTREDDVIPTSALLKVIQDVLTYTSPSVGHTNSCHSCFYSELPHSGIHCYHFREEPAFCGLHKVVIPSIPRNKCS
jgi:hypothetical protein